MHTTLEPTAELVRRRAALMESEISLTTWLCDGAFAALSRSDTAAHDQAIADGLARLVGECDVIILAQASMARVADALPAHERPVPVLSSPRSGVESVKAVLAPGAATRAVSATHWQH